jgi:type VI secretion system protein ImpE
MQVEDSIREGNLGGALSQAQREVRNNPKEPKHRVLLFQILSLMGQWEPAANELKELGTISPNLMPMVHTYFTALEYEAFRADVFAGKKTPVVFGRPEPWVALLIQALRLVIEKKFEEAKTLRDQAFEAAPAISGAINDEPFTWIADADSRLGPMFEVMLTRGYYWIPFSKIRSIELDKPTDLRDLVWLPATLTFTNGGKTVALIPTRYPGSEVSADNKARLARLTNWVERPGETFLGLGQRMLTTDKGDYPLLDVRGLALDSPDEPDETSAAQAAPADAETAKPAEASETGPGGSST